LAVQFLLLYESNQSKALLRAKAIFHVAVEKLPYEKRELVGLLWYEGVTQKEAGTVLGVSLRTEKRCW
jgi:DNA-directed RNA polymerase specialized sigma24 family protein